MTSDLMVVVDSLQGSVESLVKDGIIEAEKVGSILEEIDKAQEDIVTINEAVKKKADQGALEAAKAGVTASAPINPYAVPMLLIINILEALAIWNEKKKINGLKKGVSHATGESSPEEAKRIFDTIKSDATNLIGQKIM